MGVIESVKKGFATAKASTSLILVLFSFSFIWNIINLVAAPDEEAVAAGTPVSLLVLGVLFILLSIFMQAGSLGYVNEVIKAGKSTIGKFKESGQKYYFRILGIGIIVALFVLILTIIAVFIVFLGGGGEAPNPVAVIVSMVIAAIGVVGVLLLFLAPYAAIVDDSKVIEAIQKSIATVKANAIKVIGIGLILLVVGFVVGFVIGLLLGLLNNVLVGMPGQIASGFVSSIVNAYLGVVTTGAFMAFYLSLKGGSPEPAA